MVLQPVGPLNPAVYWARRVALMVMAVVLLVAVIWLVRGSSGNDSGGPGLAAAGADGTGVTSPTASGTAGTTPKLTGELASAQASAAPEVSGDRAGDPSAGGSEPPVSSSAPASTPAVPGTAGATDAPVATASAPAGSQTAAPTIDVPDIAVVQPPTDPDEQAAAALLAEQKKVETLKREKVAAEERAREAEKVAAEKAAKKAAAAEQEAAEKKEKAAAAEAEKAAAAAAKAEAEAKAAEVASRTFDAQGRLNCPDSFLGLTATTRSADYPVGSRPVLGVVVTNVGDQACVRDLSGTLQEYRVYTKAGQQIWSTQDCFPGTGSEQRSLQPGETVQYNITWAGTTSSPGCTAERLPAPAGEYLVEARVGTLVSARAGFVLTG